MALSEQEQRLLAQLEASLAADDPDLARTLRGSSAVERSVAPRRLGLCAIGFLLGVVTLVAAVRLHPLVGLVGFLLMLVSALSARSMLAGLAPRESRVAHGPAAARREAQGPFPRHAHGADEGH